MNDGLPEQTARLLLHEHLLGYHSSSVESYKEREEKKPSLFINDVAQLLSEKPPVIAKPWELESNMQK